MAIKLPRLPRAVAIVGKDGWPAQMFQQWWQSVAVALEGAIRTLQGAVQDITDILVRLGLVEITADGALELSESAINPDGTIKSAKVLTDSITTDGVTVPWFVASSAVIIFPGSPAIRDILSTSIVKDIDESDLVVETQIELFGNDAVNIDVACQIIDAGSTVVALKDYRVQVDGNSVTHMPLAYKFVFQGLDAGAYTVKITGARYNSNTVETVGDYFMDVREFKR